MSSNIMNYIPEVLHSVRSVLGSIEMNQGKITSKLLKAELERLKGQWPSEVINVALIALGQKPALNGMVASEAQINALVIMASRDFSYIIGKIQAMRKAREQAKEQAAAPAPVQEEEPTITIVDLYEEGDDVPMSAEELKEAEEKGLLHWQQPLMLTAAQAAVRLGVNERRIRVLCANGSFPDVQKHGSAWAIPGANVRAYAATEHRAGRPSRSNRDEQPTEADLRQHFENEEQLIKDQNEAMAAEQRRNEREQWKSSILVSEHYWIEKSEEEKRRREYEEA